MCDFGIAPDNYNPRIFYLIKRKFNFKSTVSYHSHDFISLIYILSGECTYNINDSLYKVKKGDVVICNPGIMHSKILNPDDEVIEFHVGLNNICVENLPKDHLINNNACPVVSLVKYEQDFFRCCNDILVEQEKGEPGRGLILKALVMKLIVILLREINVSESPQDKSTLNLESYDKVNMVDTIVSFINENYMKEISLDKISKSMYLSQVYISKVFKEEMGESPINYLIKVRLSKAAELLEEGSMSIKSVAKSVGYDDVYHFSKLFKKYYGSPPSKYKGEGTHAPLHSASGIEFP